jgi:hypothetical protein
VTASRSARNKKVAVLGASLGGLVAAAELRARGFEPVVLERGKTVGGLFNKIDTPFGVQELGMHVVYVTERHHQHLDAIFGSDLFGVLSGTQVDIGASHNFGRTWFNSLYPCLLEHPACATALEEILAGGTGNRAARHAGEELELRFGRTAGSGIVRPILEKLWLQDADQLTRNALHCFFDLRRIVVCDKERADRLKRDARLDAVIANPDQLRPAGGVFGGRRGLAFRDKSADLGARVATWCARSGVALYHESAVTADAKGLALNGRALAEEFAACIVTMPVHAYAQTFGQQLDLVELSLYYFQLDRRLAGEFPAYYVLCHDPGIAASRIVNYDGYNPRAGAEPSIVAVEVIHRVGAAPAVQAIGLEVERVLGGVGVRSQFRAPAALKTSAPSLHNAAGLDAIEQALRAGFSGKPLYFTGMRTDTGVFFSHHTIGLAYDAAVDCAARLS